jgi:hypothetical protein
MRSAAEPVRIKRPVIEEYIVVRNRSNSAMTVEIQAMLKEGWQPLGGIATAKSGKCLYQAMVKFAKEIQ